MVESYQPAREKADFNLNSDIIVDMWVGFSSVSQSIVSYVTWNPGIKDLKCVLVRYLIRNFKLKINALHSTVF